MAGKHRSGSSDRGWARGALAAAGAVVVAAVASAGIAGYSMAASSSPDPTVAQAMSVLCSALGDPGPCAPVAPVTDTATVTATVTAPGPTVTVQAPPSYLPGPTVTEPGPTVTVTATLTPSPTPAPSPTLSPSNTPTPTSAALGGCLTFPSECGYPDATNTGVHGTLTPSGSITSTTNGEVIQNLDVIGYIKVTSANVTIQNVRVTGGNTFGAIDLHSATGHTTITDVTLVATNAQLAVITARDMTLTRGNLSGGQDGIDAWGDSWGGKNLVQDSFIHSLGRNTAMASHDDTLQTSGGDETFTHNTLLPFDGTDPMNSCLQIGALQGNLAQLTFDNNLCDGGNYSINANSSGVGSTITAGPLTFANNRFGKDYRYGIKIHLGSPFTTTWTNNTDDATGNPV